MLLSTFLKIFNNCFSEKLSTSIFIRIKSKLDLLIISCKVSGILLNDFFLVIKTCVFEKYGSWETVYNSQEWPNVMSQALSVGLTESYRCGNWPPIGHKCESCGVIGDG